MSDWQHFVEEEELDEQHFFFFFLVSQQPVDEEELDEHFFFFFSQHSVDEDDVVHDLCFVSQVLGLGQVSSFLHFLLQHVAEVS